MRLISTLYVTDTMEVTLNIRSRNEKGDIESGGPLVTRYISKQGNQSLIFNPTVALILRSRDPNQRESAWITTSIFYRFCGILTKMYSLLSEEKLYHVEKASGAIFLDKKEAANATRKLTLYRNTLMFVPDLRMDRSRRTWKGVRFQLDSAEIGFMNHNDILSLIDILDHLDVSNFSLIAGVIDEIATLSSKVEAIDMKLDRMLKLMEEMSQTKPKKEENRFDLPWESLDNDLFR